MSCFASLHPFVICITLFLMSLLDLLFPKHCIGCRRSGEYLCPSCFANISFEPQLVCAVCNRWSIDGKTHPLCLGKYTLDGTFAAVSYKGIVRKLIYQLKYQPYLTDLLPQLGALCYESLIQQEIFVQSLNSRPVLVPIPLSIKRLRKRGYNQAELLANELGRRFELEVWSLLQRVKETKPQYGLKREERIENMKGAFTLTTALSQEERGKRKIVILVDDVLTTGSTMSEAAKILKRNGFGQVWGVALAKD